MMLALGEYHPPKLVIDALVGIGYEDFSEAGVALRRYFRRRADSAFNLHAAIRNGEHWSKNIALWNYLRSSAGARARFTAAKQHAIAVVALTLLKYSEAKAGVIADLPFRRIPCALFRPVSNNCTGELDNTLTPDGVYKLVRDYPDL